MGCLSEVEAVSKFRGRSGFWIQSEFSFKTRLLGKTGEKSLGGPFEDSNRFSHFLRLSAYRNFLLFGECDSNTGTRVGTSSLSFGSSLPWVSPFLFSRRYQIDELSGSL